MQTNNGTGMNPRTEQWRIVDGEQKYHTQKE